jgi:phenylalanyl-tRNA synthetase alpha chain
MTMDFEALKEEALREGEALQDVQSLEAYRVKYLGRKEGRITLLLKSLKDMPIENRKKLGFAANELRKEIEVLIERAQEKLGVGANAGASFDMTRPHAKARVGYLHPLTKIEMEIRDIFLSLNFSSVDGPEVETEYNNFDALNIPKDHPAREMWDTLWLKGPASEQEGNPMPEKKGKFSSISDRLLLRTHTSPMQIRYMQMHEPPFQIIVPGKTFRNEATDATHEINFHQIEGLMVGKDVSLANFKYVIDRFFERLFKQDVKVRLRPSYFPFVEPGLEVDIQLKGSGKWLEVAGAGMVHPNVFAAVGYDPKEVSGFAFGFGLERLAMIKYGISDIRLFYSGDLRFINQPYK